MGQCGDCGCESRRRVIRRKWLRVRRTAIRRRRRRHSRTTGRRRESPWLLGGDASGSRGCGMPACDCQPHRAAAASGHDADENRQTAMHGALAKRQSTDRGHTSATCSRSYPMDRFFHDVIPPYDRIAFPAALRCVSAADGSSGASNRATYTCTGCVGGHDRAGDA